MAFTVFSLISQLQIFPPLKFLYRLIPTFKKKELAKSVLKLRDERTAFHFYLCKYIDKDIV